MGHTPGIETSPTTLMVLSEGVIASLTERPTRSAVASERLAPSANRRSIWSLPE